MTPWQSVVSIWSMCFLLCAQSGGAQGDNPPDPELEYDLLWESYDSNEDSWFAWLRSADNGAKVKLFEADGQARESVPRSLQHPTWSRNGQKLAYYLDMGDHYTIYEYDMDRRIRRELTTGVFPSYSPSGDFLVYTAVSLTTDTTELWMFGKGGIDKRITNLAQECLWPSWSPDGKRILFNSFDDTWNIYLLDVTSGTPRALTKGDRAVEHAIWSPDGKRIAYWILRSDQIVVADLKGKTISKTAKGSRCRLGSFSPDGSKLLLSKFWGGELLLHDCVTSKTTEILRMDGHLKFPCYSPDGKWVAFQFNEHIGRKTKGRWDVYVVPASGGKPFCLTSKFDAHSVAPCWRPRGGKKEPDRAQDLKAEQGGAGQPATRTKSE